MGRSQASKDGWTGGDLRGAGESPVYSVCMQGRAQWLHCPPARGQVVPPHGDRQGPSPLLGQALPRFPQDPLLLSRAQAASGVTHPPLRGSPCHPRRHCPPVVESGGQEKQRPFLHALGGYCPPPAVRSLGGLVLQGTQPRPEPPALRPSPAPGQGVRGGGPSPMCMHLCQEHVWAETQPTRPDGWGCSNVLSHSGIWRSGWAQRRKGLPLAATALPPGLRQALAGLPPLQALVRQPFPLRGARAARGLILLPQHPPALSYTSAWFSQASPGHRMGPAGSAVSHLHLKGSVVTRGGCLQILPTRPAGRMSPATAASAPSSAATPPSLLRP